MTPAMRMLFGQEGVLQIWRHAVAGKTEVPAGIKVSDIFLSSSNGNDTYVQLFAAGGLKHLTSPKQTETPNQNTVSCKQMWNLDPFLIEIAEFLNFIKPNFI